jgi:hypothetical protein
MISTFLRLSGRRPAAGGDHLAQLGALLLDLVPGEGGR